MVVYVNQGILVNHVKNMINQDVIPVVRHAMGPLVQTVFFVRIMLIIVVIDIVYVKTIGLEKTVRIIKVHVIVCV